MDRPVVELRRYTLVPRRRDEMIAVRRAPERIRAWLTG
jgi:hypothetical protein